MATATANSIKTIGVVGSGTMGAGIAQIAAQAGYNVIMNDVETSFLERALKGIQGSLAKFKEKGKLTEEDFKATLDRLTHSVDLSKVAEADLVIEAITEKIEAKKDLFGRLDELCPAHTILATNTSSLSVTEMARSTKRADKVVGMHFFNPPALMKLVEVVRTPLTSEESFQTAWEVAGKLGKSPVEARDTPGFLFNRLIIPYLNEATWAVYEGVGSVEDIDAAMKLGGNMPIGPLALLDMIGTDVQLLACEGLLAELGNPKFEPCPLNRAMVRAGYLGRKSGKGFYDYSVDPPKGVDMSVFRR